MNELKLPFMATPLTSGMKKLKVEKKHGDKVKPKTDIVSQHTVVVLMR